MVIVPPLQGLHYDETHFLNSTMGISTVNCIGSQTVYVLQFEPGSSSDSAILCVSEDGARSYKCHDMSENKVRPVKFVSFGDDTTV